MTELSHLAEEEITLPCALAAWARVGPTWKCLPERALNGPCGREVVGLARQFWSKSAGTIPFLFFILFFLISILKTKFKYKYKIARLRAQVIKSQHDAIHTYYVYVYIYIFTFVCQMMQVCCTHKELYFQEIYCLSN
jgi:uncharacterized membrane protein